jgi:hypothetical protein
MATREELAALAKRQIFEAIGRWSVVAPQGLTREFVAAVESAIDALAASQTGVPREPTEAKDDPRRAEAERAAGYWHAFTRAIATRGATLRLCDISRPGLPNRTYWECVVGKSTALRSSPAMAVNGALMLEFDQQVPESFGLPPSTLRRLVPSDAAPSQPEARQEGLREALAGLMHVIDAAGLHNLSRGVQLGPISWFVKASDACDTARAALARHPKGEDHA